MIYSYHLFKFFLKFIEIFLRLKKILTIISCFLIFLGCTTNIPTNQSENQSLSFDKNDEDEYDLIVMDLDYEYYLKAIAPPENFYSESYYKTKNEFFVMEWNLRNSQPLNYDPNFYTSRIDYNPRTNYGLHFEYKLYHFFKFIEWKYKIRL